MFDNKSSRGFWWWCLFLIFMSKETGMDKRLHSPFWICLLGLCWWCGSHKVPGLRVETDSKSQTWSLPRSGFQCLSTLGQVLLCSLWLVGSNKPCLPGWVWVANVDCEWRDNCITPNCLQLPQDLYKLRTKETHFSLFYPFIFTSPKLVIPIVVIVVMTKLLFDGCKISKYKIILGSLCPKSKELGFIVL